VSIIDVLPRSINKSLSVGICAGERVFVCDNLAFSGKVVTFRKHTALFNNEVLEDLARQAVASLSTHFAEFDGWLNRIGAIPLNEKHIKQYLYAISVEEGIIPPSKLTEIHNYILGESPAPECTHDFRGFHGAITRSLRNESLFSIESRSGQLVSFINNWINKK